VATGTVSGGSSGGLRDSAWSLFQGSARTILPVLICSESQEDTERIDEAVTELLSTYGYSDSDILLSKKFRGSWFTLRIHKKTKDVEKDFELILGSESPPTELSPEKRKAYEKLERILAGVYGFLIVGTLLVASIGAASDLVKKYHEVFPPEQSQVVTPAPQDSSRIIGVKLPQATIPAVVNADSDTDQLKFLIGYNVADQLQSQAVLIDRKRFFPSRGRSYDPPSQ